jgi:hypothetical protein
MSSPKAIAPAQSFWLALACRRVRRLFGQYSAWRLGFAASNHGPANAASRGWCQAWIVPGKIPALWPVHTLCCRCRHAEAGQAFCICRFAMTAPEFIAKWSGVDLTERSAARQHFLDLCELAGRRRVLKLSRFPFRGRRLQWGARSSRSPNPPSRRIRVPLKFPPPKNSRTQFAAGRRKRRARRPCSPKRNRQN